MEIDGIECYEQNGTAYLKLETVARGLGFTQNKNGTEYIIWKRVFNYLQEINFSTQVGKDGYIPENVFYRLAMKAKNKVAEAFQAKIADEVIPSIRRTGSYGVPNNLAETINLLADSVNYLSRRIEQMENKPQALPAPVSPVASELERKKWMRLVNKKLDLITALDGCTRNEVLHVAYNYLEESCGVSLNEVRLKHMEKTGSEGTVIETIYDNKIFREEFQFALDSMLPQSYRVWEKE